MRQVWVTRAGPPETLQVREAPDPVPGPGQVRLRVAAAGVNFADVMMRLGIYPDAPPLPAVPGYEAAGVIDAVGEGVPAARVGERVLAFCRFGGYADLLCVAREAVFPVPDGVPLTIAAALPVNYLTAWQMLVVMAGVKAGDTVLVHGAAGGVGLAAVDLCRRAGARVFGSASPAKHAALAERGVEFCIDSPSRKPCWPWNMSRTPKSPSSTTTSAPPAKALKNCTCGRRPRGCGSSKGCRAASMGRRRPPGHLL